MAPNNEHYETHDYAGDQAIDVRQVMNHMPDEDRSTTQQIQQSINSSQAAELAPDVRMGDDRVIGDTPNWASYSSEQLYNFATQNNSPTTADDLGRTFNEGGNSLAEAANALLDAVTRLDGAWSGVAADSAKDALKPLAQASGVAGQTAQLMGVRMSQQSVAATEVRKLPPAKTYNAQQSLNAMLTGGPLALQQDLKAQQDAADAVKREQISYLTTYTASMSQVDAQTPSFVPPKSNISGSSSSSSSFTGGSVYIPGTGGDVPVTRRDDGTTTGQRPGKVTGVAGPNGNPDPGFFDGQTDQTDQSGYTPLPGPGTNTAGYQPPTAPPSTTFGPAGGPPVGGTGVPSAGAGGFGGNFGNFGSPASGGAASGPGGNPAAGGPRGMAPAGMAPAGGPGGPGGRGGAGGPMGGAPRGKSDGEEDQEHERPSYLVEGDPESTFGTDAMTAPPVIGGND